MSLEDTSEELETTEEPSLVDELTAAADKLETPETAEPTTAKEGVSRDINGKFSAKTDTVAENDNIQATPQADQSAQKPQIDLSQLGYNKAEQEKLQALPEDVLNVLVERNNRYHQGLQPLRQKADIADSFIGAIRPHAEYLQALQVAPEDFISSMLSTEKTLRLGSVEQKVNMLQRLAHDYQIPLEALGEMPFDPQLAQLQQRLEHQDRYIANLNRSQQTNQQTQTEQMIAQWSQGKEHFDALRETMADLLNGGMANDLDDAYDKAKRLNGLYSQPASQQQAVARDQKARRALNGAVQVKGNANTGANEPVFTSLADELMFRANQAGY